jgi:membrane-bound metal-dependent hydrolase YbcI (DUF457 family)
MFLGHGLLAFAVVAFFGEWRNRDRTIVLSVALLAGLFATLPDVDVVYGLAGLADAVAITDPESFWAAGNRTHRGLTHSVPVGVATALAAGLLVRRDAGALAGVTVLAGVVATAVTMSGLLAGLVAIPFAAGVLGLVGLARHLEISPPAVAGVALVGLVSHPFGDLFTGTPPEFLFPFDAVLVTDRVLLASDPTIHLLGAFGLELVAAWLALAAYFRLTDRRLLARVDRRAAIGASYGAAALVLPAPTLDVSYHFVFSVIGVGAVGVTRPSFRLALTSRSVATALATVSVAGLSYAVVYLLTTML